ncbi:MAG TPA: GTPase Era [Anaerolineales bacterium]|nr:GTPase Era [Anaerolineales bacterium]
MDPNASVRPFKAGYVALAGRPNVGKSTLVNRYLNQLVAAVSPRPQTTRRRQLGILTLPGAQIIFVDTPGLHEPQHRLGEALNYDAQEAIKDADVVLAVFDASEPPTAEDRLLADTLSLLPPTIAGLAALNKMDLASSSSLEGIALAFRSLLPAWEFWEISAARGDRCDALLARLIELLPEGPAYFPEDQVTETYERDIAADLIRAAAMGQLRQELPHSIAVRIEEFRERDTGGAYILATIFVERESQKGIVIGRGGERLKAIGTEARKEIEAMSGRSCFLELRVRVLPNWRSDPKALADFGFRLPPTPGEAR